MYFSNCFTVDMVQGGVRDMVGEHWKPIDEMIWGEMYQQVTRSFPTTMCDKWDKMNAR